MRSRNKVTDIQMDADFSQLSLAIVSYLLIYGRPADSGPFGFLHGD